MTPDERSDPDGPTKPLPVEGEPGPTEPMVAAHVPVADVSTAPMGPAGAPAPRAPVDRSRALMWGLITAAAVLGIAVIVFLTLYLQNGRPVPALTPTPSPSLTVTTPPTEGPPIDVPEDPADDPDEPAPEPTDPPEPTEPPDPEPTPTPTEVAP